MMIATLTAPMLDLAASAGQIETTRLLIGRGAGSQSFVTHGDVLGNGKAAALDVPEGSSVARFYLSV